MTISERILEIINKKKITRTDFANTLNITQAYVSKIINKGAIPSERLIEDICEKFGINKEWLRTGAGGDENMFVKLTPYERAYNRFGYIMENSSPSKKAALAVLLELVYEVPDDKWELIMKQYEEIKRKANQPSRTFPSAMINSRNLRVI